ncbi:Oligogalacturonate-specific porin kdgM precursor [Pluralibacter gergoviae]|nr:Oligogalacturonate-specific porin kdgM precursor [Pluralibacter gergoviae]
MVQSTKTSEKGFNLTGVISLVELSNSQIDYELDYKKTSTGGVVLANNKNHEWAHDIKLTYKINSSWSPHIAVGNVSGSRHTSERQTRYRVGVSYLFLTGRGDKLKSYMLIKLACKILHPALLWMPDPAT